MIEDDLAKTEYKDWYHVGKEYNGTFDLVDFQKGRTLVSVKSADTRGSGWLSHVKGHIEDLGTNGATVSGRRAKMKLDLRVQPGGLAAARPLVKWAQRYKVVVTIKEYH
jgi:filamentous hemagglutinin